MNGHTADTPAGPVAVVPIENRVLPFNELVVSIRYESNKTSITLAFVADENSQTKPARPRTVTKTLANADGEPMAITAHLRDSVSKFVDSMPVLEDRMAIVEAYAMVWVLFEVSQNSGSMIAPFHSVLSEHFSKCDQLWSERGLSLVVNLCEHISMSASRLATPPPECVVLLCKHMAEKIRLLIQSHVLVESNHTDELIDNARQSLKHISSQVAMDALSEFGLTQIDAISSFGERLQQTCSKADHAHVLRRVEHLETIQPDLEYLQASVRDTQSDIAVYKDTVRKEMTKTLLEIESRWKARTDELIDVYERKLRDLDAMYRSVIEATEENKSQRMVVERELEILGARSHRKL